LSSRNSKREANQSILDQEIPLGMIKEEAFEGTLKGSVVPTPMDLEL
jgi:hypothetical protein